MKKNVNLSRIVATILTLFMVWGGVTGCNQQPPATNTFTITFDSNGGSEVPAITKEEGAVVEAPSAPTKTGYTFVEWQKEDGTAYDWTAPLTASITLKAKWDPVSYTITYLPEGVETDNPTTYTIEDETITLKDPTKGPDATKPNFVGWYEDEACTIAATGIEKGSTGDKTFYAKYTDIAVYTVKFILDGKDFGKAQKVEEGKAVTAIEGYDMYSDKELTKAFDIKTEIKAETTIYLKVKEFTVTFNSDGGSAVAAAKVKYNETVKEPAAPTKEGFNFDGWYNGDTKFDFTTKITKDLTLKAKWKAEGAETPSIVPVTKNEDGTYSFADGTYQFIEEGGNSILKFGMPEGTEFKAGDTIKITGTINFGEDTPYKQCFIQTLDEAGIALFGYDMIQVADWDAGRLSGDVKVNKSSVIEKDYAPNYCKFQMNAPHDGEAAMYPIVTLKDVKITYIPYDPNANLEIDLTNKTVKNSAPFTKAYDGFQINFDNPIDVTEYSTVKVGCKFFDASDKEIEATWGLGQYLLLTASDQSWDGVTLLTQYNLGMQDASLEDKTGTVKAIAIQNSTVDVAYIEITSIQFVK